MLLKDEEILACLIELSYIFIRDHFCRILDTNLPLATRILQAIRSVTFNLVVDNEELTEDIIDWNGLFIRCLDIWQAFFDTLQNSSNSHFASKPDFIQIYPNLMEALVQAIQARGSAKVAGLDRQRNYTAN